MTRIWSLTVQPCWSLAHRSKLNRDRPCVPLKTLGQASVMLVGWENWGVSQLLESMLHSLGKSPPRAQCLSSVEGQETKIYGQQA